MTSSARNAPIALKHADKLFIGGRWVAAKKGGRIEVISPHTESVAAVVAEATEADMEDAVAAARKAFDFGPWPRMSVAERVGYLNKIAAVLKPREADIARAWTEQIGSLASVAPFVIGGAMQSFGFYAAMAETYPFEERLTPGDGHGEAIVVREPVGVVAAIVPWNNPFGIMIAKVVPALMTGCTVVMKPSPETPIDAHLIAEAAEAAGLPEGVLNLAPSHRDAADHLARHPGVDKVSFTGSVPAGRRIASVCGARIARCTLELGGKSAAIVLDDYDIAAAAKSLTSTITMSAGQVCATLSRAIVSRKRHGDLIDALKAEMAAIKVGDPYDPASQMGPLAMQRQRDRVEGYIAKGKDEGAELAFGGARPAHLNRGFYIEPTLFANVTRKMTIAQEEIFGPVMSVLACEDEAEAVSIANDSSFGLYGAVYTSDRDKAYRIARQIRTGTVTQNIFRFDHTLPFGGFKQSGLGREGGIYAVHGFTELKSVLLDGPAQ